MTKMEELIARYKLPEIKDTGIVCQCGNLSCIGCNLCPDCLMEHEGPCVILEVVEGNNVLGKQG